MAGAFPQYAGSFDPLQNQLNLARYNQAQELLPADTAAKKAELESQSQLAPLKVEEAKRANALSQFDLSDRGMAEVARAAQTADPSEAPSIWDDGMKKLAGQGVDSANQYVGRYRLDLAERVGDAYGGQGAQAKAPAGFDTDAAMRGIMQLKPEQRAASLKNMNSVISGFNRVRDEDSWKAEVAALREAGIPVDQMFSPDASWQMNYAVAHKIIQGLVPMRDLMQQAVATQSMGGPVVQPKPMYEPYSQYVGVDPSGRPIYHDVHSGQDIVGTTTIGAKPVAPKSTVFEQKKAAWLDLHPGDEAGALEFSSGKRQLSPAEMMRSSISEANRALGDAVLAGAAIPDADAWVKQRTAENYKAISGAQAPATAGAGAPGALPQRATDALRKAGGRAIRFNNGQTWKMGPNGKPVRAQ